jgi:putative DNA primase/helicase
VSKSRTATGARPQALPVVAEAIPEALRALARWVTWAYVEEADRETGEVDWDKPPRNARTGGLASSTNPRTWSTFDVAVAAYQRGGLDGIGFVMHRAEGDDGPVPVAIDLDHCRDPRTGAIEPWALAVIQALNSNTEVSPSGTGIRIFVLGRLPPQGRKRGNFEVYETGRYVTVTGQRVEGTPATLEERQGALERVHREVFADRCRQAAPSSNGNGHAAVLDLRDEEILDAARRAKNGSKFTTYWNGGNGDLHSASEGDLALCSMLAFWCGPDPERIDELFRQSGRFRSKWNRDDYRRRTIGKAIEGCKEFYEPRPPQKPAAGKPRQPDAAAAGARDPDGGPARPSAYDLILAYLRDYYQPTFRRGAALYSARLGREVRSSEACFAPGRELAERLLTAWDCPRSETGPKRSATPKLFRDWAPSAWRDLLATLPEEEGAGEIADAACEHFRSRLAGALQTMVALAYTHHGDERGERTEVQRRSLISWCRLFARGTRWQAVRSYQVCVRRDGGRLRVALRVGLFGQLHAGADLAGMSPRQFSDLCALYGCGTPCKVQGGKARAVELAEDFLAEQLAEPEADEPAGEAAADTGAGETQTDGRRNPRTRAREENASVCPGQGAMP